MKVLVAGAHGLTGQQLVTSLEKHRHDVIGIIRPGKQDHRKDLMKRGIYKVIEADLVKDVDKLEEAIRNMDAFVFAAGASSKLSYADPSLEDTTAIDRDSAITTADLCARHSVMYFMISALGAEDPESHTDLSKHMKHYMRCKHEADKHLVKLGREQGLKYVILRAGQLTDKEGVGHVVAKVNAHAGDFGHEKNISRMDVAETIAELIKQGDKLSGKVIGVVGGTEKIQHALERIVKEGAAAEA